MKNMMPNTRLLKDFISLAFAKLSYNEENKAIFHRLGKRVMKAIAEEMGLQTGTFDIRSNMAGIACSGEVTLHGESIYIQFCEPMNGLEVLYRSCNGRKDYSGGNNNWMRYEDLLDLPKACMAFKRVMGG